MIQRFLPRSQSGFTIPELLVVLGLFAILGGVSFMVLKPQHFDDINRNAGRMTDTAFLVQTFNKYYAAKGILPESIPTKETIIGTEEDNYDLCKDLVPEFIKDVPFDPSLGLKSMPNDACNAKGQRYVSSYSIVRSQDRKTITIIAPFAERGQEITITKRYE